MAEEDHRKEETPMEKIADKIHNHDSSSSSDSEGEKKTTSSVESKIRRLFGRQQPVHKVLGGGKQADVLLWRNKKISAGVLGGATAIYILFKVLEYHLLSAVCHALILALTILFLWSTASSFINKSTPHILEVHIPEEPVLQFVSAFMSDVNRGLAVLRDIASGRDLKMFLMVIAGLWIVSILGSCCDFLTLFYIAVVLLHTLPVLYEKYEDQVDAFAEEDKNKSNWTEQVREVWEEIVFKKKFINIEQKMNENQDQIRTMIKEEVTKVWNESTSPTLKLILEKLNMLTSNIERKEKLVEEIEEEPESSTKKHLENTIILKKTSKNSLYSEAENKMLDKLTELRKQGKI